MLDRTLYLVISNLDGPIIYEVELSRMDRERVLRELREGQYRDVLQIFELIPSERICREVTDEPDFRDAAARDADDA